MIAIFNYKFDLNTIITAFLSIFLIGFLADISLLRDSGIIISVILFLYSFINEKTIIVQNIKKIIFKDKTTFSILIILLASMFFSSGFAYYNSYISLHYLSKAILNISLFGLILASLEQNKIVLTIIKYSIVTAFIIIILKFILFYPGTEYKLDRMYSSYFELLFPFIFTMFVFSKKSPVYAFLSAISIIMVLFTGARGAYGAGLVEIIIIIIFSIYTKKSSMKQILGRFTFIFIGLSILLPMIYFSTSTIKQNVERGLNPSGRDLIIKERLPLFFLKVGGRVFPLRGHLRVHHAL